jgi:hypothetical protein
MITVSSSTVVSVTCGCSTVIVCVSSTVWNKKNKHFNKIEKKNKIIQEKRLEIYVLACFRA